MPCRSPAHNAMGSCIDKREQRGEPGHDSFNRFDADAQHLGNGGTTSVTESCRPEPWSTHRGDGGRRHARRHPVRAHQAQGGGARGRAEVVLA